MNLDFVSDTASKIKETTVTLVEKATGQKKEVEAHPIQAPEVTEIPAAPV